MKLALSTNQNFKILPEEIAQLQMNQEREKVSTTTICAQRQY